MDKALESELRKEMDASMMPQRRKKVRFLASELSKDKDFIKADEHLKLSSSEHMDEAQFASGLGWVAAEVVSTAQYLSAYDAHTQSRMKQVKQVSNHYFKNPTLRRWRVVEVVATDGTISRHVYGHDVTNDTGRVSSAIKQFDREAMTAVTYSGSQYTLMSLPGNTRDGNEAWQDWCRINNIISEKDVTNEYFVGQNLFVKGLPSILTKQ